MKKECSLIVTLPNLNDTHEINKIIDYDEIDSFRFNSGVNQLMSNKEQLYKL